MVHLYQSCGRVSEAWDWLFALITTGLGLPPASVSEDGLLRMNFDVSHYFEKEVTWLLEATELRSVLRKRKVAGRMRKVPLLNLWNL